MQMAMSMVRCVDKVWNLIVKSLSLMKKTHMVYPLHDVVGYINWNYFFYAWGIPARFSSVSDLHECGSCKAMWLASFSEENRQQAVVAMQLYEEAKKMLCELDKYYTVHTLCRLCEAYADGDDLWLDNVRLPLLRQQWKTDDDCCYLCLSDFVRPRGVGDTDIVGVFVAAIDPVVEQLYADDSYKRMLVQTLADRLAEAAVEKMHEYVRKSFWGYAANEQLTMRQLHNEEFQGIRPAVGYPSLPDHSINFILDELLDFSTIDVRLTENGAMRPHASVSGLLLAHPKARYFNIGRISREQLSDYAGRRSMSEEEMTKYIGPLLG